jgi:hypothetical protein
MRRAVEKLASAVAVAFSYCHPRKGSAVVLAFPPFGLEPGLSPALKPGLSPALKPLRRALALCPEQRRAARSEAAGEATDLIAFVFALNFFLQIQPKNRMSSPKTTQATQKTRVSVGILVIPN